MSGTAALSSPPHATPPLLALLLACVVLALAACGVRRGRAAAAEGTADRRPPTPEDTGGEQGAAASSAGEPAPKEPSVADKPKRASSTPARPTSRRWRRTAATFEITLDAKRAPQDGRLVQVPRRQGLLRRARLPPHRPRLRDPGRRPEGRRHRRARLLGRRGAAGGPRVHAGRRGDGQDRSSRSRARRAASSSSSPARTPQPRRPTTRCVGKVTDGEDVVDRSASLPSTPTSSRSSRS